MKKLATLAIATGLIVSLSSCAADPEEAADLELNLSEGSCQPSGSEIESVEFSGGFGEVPGVTFEAPLEVSSTQRLVLSEGDGEVVKDGDNVLFSYALYNAATGDALQELEDFDPSVFRLDTVSPVLVGVSLTVACSKMGSRVAGLLPAEEAFGPDGAPEFGLNPGEPILFVVDVISLDRIEGEPRETSDGFPAVEYAGDGSPTVTIPEGEDAPTEFAVDTVITGSGDVVSAGDRVTVNYQGVNWNTGEVFDSSWPRGQPSSFPTDGVIDGFRDGLVGQTVGSRVIIVIPAELGYGPRGGQPSAGIGPEDTIVFVVDILFAR